MKDLAISQLLENNPDLKRMSEYTLFTTKEEVNSLYNGGRIVVESEVVLVEYLKRILDNDFYFEYATRFFSGVINRFDVAYIYFGDTMGTINYQRSTIINGIEELIKNGQIVLDQSKKERFEYLRKYISYENFINKYNKDVYSIDIDGTNYNIPVSKIISLMELSDDKFKELCSNQGIKTIEGIKKEYFIYAALKYFLKNNVIYNYLVPSNVKKHYVELRSFEVIDFQAINTHLVTKDIKYQSIEIETGLKKEILSGMPPEVSDLEKAIYIYIKMCKLLTYDDEYYAVNQKGIATKKHKDPAYVSKITLENNKVVCFEFNLMYSKLLNDLGIKFCSDYKNMVGEVYGDGHANLEFRSDKFLVNADSVTSILKGDIMRAKLNQPLEGLRCLNVNKKTQIEFKNSVTKMYELIAIQDRSINDKKVEHMESLDELLEEYSHTIKSKSEVNLNERLLILINKVNKTKIVGIDALSYLLQLKKILFTEEQRKNNISITIIRNNKPFDEGKIAMPSVIIVINNHSFIDMPEQNRYFYYNPNQELISISQDELQLRFDDNIFAYIDKEDPRIPGIDESRGTKR
jgi:hypothetical protein